MRDQSGRTIVALLVALAVLGPSLYLIISRTADSSVGALTDAGLQLDETRRQRTISDMRAIGDAIRLMQAETGAPPESLQALQEAGYMERVPTADGWGNAFVYMTGRDGWEIVSLGEDGSAGPPPPQPWTGGSYACDLRLVNGQIIQAPLPQ
jgi:hypothetical protein